ncbi:MAG: CBS domain-containing protein [Isosphaeraceae bacterium]
MSSLPTQPEPSNVSAEIHPEPIPLVSAADLLNPLVLVSDAMTAGPRTCSPFSSIVEAALIFRDADCGVIPVTEDGLPIGVLTDRDVALAVPEHNGILSNATVADLMTKDVVTIEVDATLETAVERLGDQGLRRLLVVDAENRLVGILSWTDLVPHLSDRGLGQVVTKIAAAQR